MGDREGYNNIIYNYILLYVMFINGWEFLFKLLFTVYAFTLCPFLKKEMPLRPFGLKWHSKGNLKIVINYTACLS